MSPAERDRSEGFTAQRLSELAKMDGANVLSSDATRIARAEPMHGVELERTLIVRDYAAPKRGRLSIKEGLARLAESSILERYI